MISREVWDIPLLINIAWLVSPEFDEVSVDCEVVVTTISCMGANGVVTISSVYRFYRPSCSGAIVIVSRKFNRIVVAVIRSNHGSVVAVSSTANSNPVGFTVISKRFESPCLSARAIWVVLWINELILAIIAGRQIVWWPSSWCHLNGRVECAICCILSIRDKGYCSNDS